MISIVGELELRCLDRMTRSELIETIRGRQAHLPVDLLERLEERASDHLRLLLLAARLIHVLRHLRRDGQTVMPPSGWHLANDG